MKEVLVLSLLNVAFALVATIHVAIVYSLAKRTPRWLSLMALIAPPTAPYWAWREHMRTRAGLWVGGVVVYLVALLLATRSS